MTDGPSPAMKLSDADRLDTLKRIAAEAREGGIAWKKVLSEDEIAAIEWAIAAAERERALEEEVMQLRVTIEYAAQMGTNRRFIQDYLRDAAQAALDRAGKAGE